MARRSRLIAALAVALLCAPGTWLRSDLSTTGAERITVTRLAGPRPLAAPGWTLAGTWHYRGTGLRFGGMSALLALEDGRLRAFSDRGYRWDLSAPDQSAAAPAGTASALVEQPVARGWAMDLTDIEAATRDPAQGTYWLGFEQTHVIHRYTAADAPAGLRDLTDEVDWDSNAGIEAMVRLADGRFVVLPEGQARGLLFADDPVTGGAPKTFRMIMPATGFKITDAAQLPDGRLLVLLRKLVRPSPQAWPPFASLLAIAPVPEAGATFAPKIALQLGGVLPRENYEGLALRARADGRVDVWLIADDNVSVFQRTLLAKLVFTP